MRDLESEIDFVTGKHALETCRLFAIPKTGSLAGIGRRGGSSMSIFFGQVEGLASGCGAPRGALFLMRNGESRVQQSDPEEPFDADSRSIKLWREVPEAIRKDVEDHVFDTLPADILATLHDLQARGVSISSDLTFFHFGGGLTVRNLCRERLSDHELAILVPFGGDWDNCYVGVLAAIGARRQ